MLLRMGDLTLQDDPYGIQLCQMVDERLKIILNPMVMHLFGIQVIQEHYLNFYQSLDVLVPQISLGVHLTAHGRWVLALGLFKAILAFLFLVVIFFVF